MVFYCRPGGDSLGEPEDKKRFVILVPVRFSVATQELLLQKQQTSSSRAVKKNTKVHVPSAKEITGGLAALEGRELQGQPLPVGSLTQD